MDNKVKLWDLGDAADHDVSGNDANPPRADLVMEGRHAHWVRAVAFSHDGALLASAGHDAQVMLWDVAQRQRLATLGHTGMVNAVAFSPDDKTLATAAWDWTLEFWDVASTNAPAVGARAASSRAARRGHRSIVSGAAFSPDGRTLATASFDDTVKLWHAASAEELITLVAESGPPGKALVHCVAFSGDGAFLVCGCENGTLRFWRK
jgi:WD40 repeat protein